MRTLFIARDTSNDRPQIPQPLSITNTARTVFLPSLYDSPTRRIPHGDPHNMERSTGEAFLKFPPPLLRPPQTLPARQCLVKCSLAKTPARPCQPAALILDNVLVTHIRSMNSVGKSTCYETVTPGLNSTDSKCDKSYLSVYHCAPNTSFSKFLM